MAHESFFVVVVSLTLVWREPFCPVIVEFSSLLVEHQFCLRSLRGLFLRLLQTALVIKVANAFVHPALRLQALHFILFEVLWPLLFW